MDQVSRPLLIALAAVVLLAAAWFTVLRPGADAPAAPDAADVVPAVEAVGEAEQAAEASEAATAARSGEPAGTPATPADPSVAPTAPGALSGATGSVDPSLAARMGEGSVEVLEQLQRGRAVVLLFWNGRSSDDRAVRRAVSRVDRRDGDVRVMVERLDELGSYAAVTNNVRVESTPTTLVIAPDGAVQAVTGYTVTRELDQAVRDALARKDDR